MKKKLVSMMLVSALAVSMLAGCGQKEVEESKQESKVEESKAEESEAEESKTEEEEPVDENAKFYDAEYLSSLVFGSSGWKIDVSEEKLEEYKKNGLKRWDGLEFTYIINDQGYDLPEGQTIDDNERVWNVQLTTGFKPVNYWVATNDAFTEKKNAAIASGDIPDLMNVNVNQYAMLVKSGLIADVTDYIYGTSYDLKNEATSGVAYQVLDMGGRIYGLPWTYDSFDGHPFVWIRQDWLEEVGLDAPTTFADVEEIALAFMEKDFDGNGKKDTVGVPLLADYGASYGGDGNMSIFFAQNGGAFPGIWQEGDDGKIIYGSIYDGAKEGLAFLNDWYNKGIIPKDFATWDGQALSAAISDNKAGIAVGPWWIGYSQLSGILATNDEVLWNPYIVTAEEGDPVYGIAGNAIRGIWVIREGYEHVEELVQACAQLQNGPMYTYDQETFSGAYVCNNTYNPLNGNGTPNAYELGGRARQLYLEGVSEEEFVETLTPYNPAKDWGADYRAYEEGKETYIGWYQQVEDGVHPRQLTWDGMTSLDCYILYIGVCLGEDYIGTTDKISVCTVFQGSTDSSEMYESFLNEFWKAEYTKMIMGETGGLSIDEYFDDFKQKYLDQGGQILADEVNTLKGR